MTLTPPIGFPSPGAVVRTFRMSSPARCDTVTSVGVSAASSDFSSGVAGASIRS